MRGLSLALLALCCTGAAQVQSAHAVARTDDRGVTVRLGGPAARIIALAPHLAEAVFAAGAGEKLVGTVRHSDYPDAARDIPRVGDAARIDIERVLHLRPDLVLAWKSGNQPNDVRRLERLGRVVFVAEPVRLGDVPRLIRDIGVLAGTEERAGASAARFEEDIAALRQRYAGRRAVPVFYEIWHRPLLTVSGRHMISDVVELCGGLNVFAGVSTLTPTVSLEAVVAARPQAIVGGASSVTESDFARQWRRYRIRTLSSVALVHLEPDTMQRPGVRLVKGGHTLCQALERVRAALP